MYTFESRIRYSETDENKTLTIPKLVDYFQDCTTFHSEDTDAGLDYMESIKMVWVIASWQLEIKRLPKVGERVIIGTQPYGFKAFLGYRNFCMQTPEGEVLCVANSLWTLLSTETGRPVNAPEEMKEKYPLGERLPMEYTNRKINLDPEREYLAPFEIRQDHLDANHHVNNGQFVVMASRYLETGFEARQFRVEYKMQAFLGDIMYPTVKTTDDTCVISLENEEHKPYVVVEYVRK